ncbi:AhpC/TSA family protein [Puniceicoccaceae bacterium K14]|nr:AhpC/TSA family protein [Puniceicoccaceae bacterium K14]
MKLKFLSAGLIAAILSLSSFAKTAWDINPILIGSELPAATIETVRGEEITLAKAINSKPTVLIFYRGGWCPYCNLHLQELAEAESDLIELGYQIIALSPDSPESLEVTLDEKGLNYSLYSDANLSAADGFGITYSLNDKTLEKYIGYGINLEKASGGKNKNRLPVSSVFIINENNEVCYSYVDPDYKFRISKDLLLAAAKNSSNFHKKSLR